MWPWDARTAASKQLCVKHFLYDQQKILFPNNQSLIGIKTLINVFVLWPNLNADFYQRARLSPMVCGECE